jgi:hypothetical protein
MPDSVSPRVPQRRIVRSTAPHRLTVIPSDPPVDRTTARYITATAEEHRLTAEWPPRAATATTVTVVSLPRSASRRTAQKLARKRREEKAARHATRWFADRAWVSANPDATKKVA